MGTMKKHAIIPVFIPHLGCPHECVFCDQNAITARTVPVSGEEVKNKIDTWLSTIEERGIENVEISFYGGSFTAIPIDLQTKYLKIGYEYVKAGRVSHLHLSTRPDYIDDEILTNLKKYKVGAIELGVQSFSDDVLLRSQRGHDTACVYKACELIRSYGFDLGIQLMVGLPGDTKELDIMSAKKTAELKPELARIYPTVVLEGTELASMLHDGTYTPLGVENAVDISKDMYRILADAGIEIMRVGLKSTDLITPGSDLGHTYHPAFRQLVEGEIAKEDMEKQIEEHFGKNGPPSDHGLIDITFTSCERCLSNMSGHKAVNRRWLENKYPALSLHFRADNSLADNTYIMLK